MVFCKIHILTSIPISVLLWQTDDLTNQRTIIHPFSDYHHLVLFRVTRVLEPIPVVIGQETGIYSGQVATPSQQKAINCGIMVCHVIMPINTQADVNIEGPWCVDPTSIS